MKHLLLFESFMQKNAHKDPTLKALYELVYDYKHNPNLWSGHQQVQKIVDFLTSTPEGNMMVPLSQNIIKQRYGNDILIYRGGENVDTNSNAGWSTNWEVALNFAGNHGEKGELVVARVKPNEVLFFDSVFNGEIKDYIDEDEVILTELGVADYMGYVDVGAYESEVDEDETYDSLGYYSPEVTDKVMHDLLTILTQKGYDNPEAVLNR